jgi:hypothetical protein
MLELYTIADIVTWLDEKTLVVNREYQRNDQVWSLAAKAYLIDTILRDLPIPSIYMRTDTNVETRRSYREIVDGQQRISAIKAFADDEFPLGTNREVFGEHAGRRFSDLDSDTQREFLEYQLPCAQLFNASDATVFDIFRRLNTYNYKLSSQELRHGKYHGRFRNAVVETSRKWSVLWDKYQVITKRSRVRMADDELTAQLYGVILNGVCDGGQPTIERLYKMHDGNLPSSASERVDLTLSFIMEKLAPVMETRLAGAPHFLMFFAAVAHARIGIQGGDLGSDLPLRVDSALEDIAAATVNLCILAGVLEPDLEEIPPRFAEFKSASSATTQRIRSRKTRFLSLLSALLPDPI